MEGKVLSIRERRPSPTLLPSGAYIGYWSLQAIELKFSGKEYVLETEDLVMDIKQKVVVIVENDLARFIPIANDEDND